MKSGHSRIAPPRKTHVRADPRGGSPSTSKRGSGRRAPATPPFWLCAPTTVGASGGWNHRRGRQRRSRRPLPGRVECPPCASRYSPGAPQSSGSPAWSALSRLMSTHARRSERLSGVIALIVRRFTIPKVQRTPSPVRGIRKRRNRRRCEEDGPGRAMKPVGPLADKHPCGASRLIHNRAAQDRASRTRCREETSHVLQHIDLADAQPSRCLR